MTKQKKDHLLKAFQDSATTEEQAKLQEMVNEHGVDSEGSSISNTSLGDEGRHFMLARSTSKFDDDLDYSCDWALGFQGVDDEENVHEEEEYALLCEQEKVYEVEFAGETFNVGDCFRVSRFDDAILGIKYFVDEETAHCVLVLPFEKSIVGVLQEELAKSISPPIGFNFLQIPCRCMQDQCLCNKASEIHLSKLLYDKTNGKLVLSLPFAAYAPKVDKSFAYWDGSPKLISKKREGPLNCIDLFCGAGGASGGMKRAGFNVVLGVDVQFEAACAFYKNHGGRNPALHRFCLDSVGCTVDDDLFYLKLFSKYQVDMGFLASYIRQGGTAVFLGTVNEFLGDWEKKQGFKEALQVNGEIHLVHQSPPSQGFSSAKRETQHDDDVRNPLSYSIVDVGRIIRPLTMSFENVLGMWRRHRFLCHIYEGLLDAGYQFRQFDHLACKAGDPQIRSCLFIVAALSHVELPDVPPATHCNANPDGSPSQLGKHVFRTAKDAIGCFEKQFLENANLPVGDEQYELVATKPAPAIRGCKAPKHYSENRLLQWQESLLLSFQPSFHLHGSDDKDNMERQRQAGNAMPIQQATALFRTIEEVLQWEYVERALPAKPSDKRPP